MSRQMLWDELPTLETLCPDCEGSGCEDELRVQYDCPECKGAGYIPTKAGKRILALMSHNFSRIERNTRHERL